MLELEKTYLLKYFPKGSLESPNKAVIDTYYPEKSKHPVLRLRQSGDKFELTKKVPVEGQNSSQHNENTILLSPDEASALLKIKGKRLSKVRYYFSFDGRVAEVDVFKGDLAGLVLVDFEFDSTDDLNGFKMPDFCLVDVTEEEFLAGGMLCGKKYADVEIELKRFGYKTP